MSTEYKLGDFFRNLIAVILGIVITFVGSDMITEHNTQKEIKTALLLVKSELLINKEQIIGMGDQVTLEQSSSLSVKVQKQNARSVARFSKTV
jgi:hypothetical protein